jgi:hypothetical protein
MYIPPAMKAWHLYLAVLYTLLVVGLAIIVLNSQNIFVAVILSIIFGYALTFLWLKILKIVARGK